MRKILISLLLFLPPLFTAAQDNQSRLSFEYYQSGEFEKAAPLFLKMYEENKVRTYLDYYARCLIELKEFDNAVRIVRREVRQNNDSGLYVLLGHIYEEMGDHKKAEESYNQPFKNFPGNPQGITSLANSYSSYLKFEMAQATYELGRKVLGTANEFRMELANVFYAQRRYPEMLDEYFALLLNNPQNLPTVLAFVGSAMNRDIDGDLLQLVRDKTYKAIQQLPGVQVYYEVLIWVLTSEKNYPEAVAQSIALDRRTNEYSDKILSIARLSAEAGDLDAALKAYQYLVVKGPAESSPAQPGRNIAGQQPFKVARIEYLLTLSEKTATEPAATTETWKELAGKFTQTVDELGEDYRLVQPLISELARINAYRLSDNSEALRILEKALETKGLPMAIRSEYLMEKGDILLTAGDPWEATFVFAMIEMENPENPAGSQAKLRKAQLSWFTGNYNWALAQLDILKGSTSKPIANDAFELSVLIRDNISETDSLQTILKSLAEADYLIFRHKPEEALVLLDSLISSYPDNPVTDDCLYKKAHILMDRGQMDQSVEVFNQIIGNYRYDFWGHKALFELGCIYQDQYNNPDKARELFEIILREFPNSFYFLDARDRLKAMRDGGIRQTCPTP